MMNRIYYFDQIRINTRQHIQYLRTILPNNALKRQCRKYYLRESSENAKKAGFKTSMYIVVPKRTFFPTLNLFEISLDLYKVSKIEMARDKLYPDIIKADSEFRKIIGTLNKKWITDHFIFDQRKADETGIITDRRFWGEQTAYYGSDSFKLVVDPASSKINGKPCLHKQFRLSGASNIKRRTGIEFIRDFINYDIENQFELWMDKYIDHASFDSKKIGKWILGWTRKKSLTRNERRELNLQIQMFCSRNNIYSFADLKNYLGRLKAEVREKKGRISSSDMKILAVQYNHFRMDTD